MTEMNPFTSKVGRVLGQIITRFTQWRMVTPNEYGPHLKCLLANLFKYLFILFKKNKMDNNFKARGDDLIKKGDKTLQGSTFGNIFGSKGERAEKALELYRQAATQYKLGKNWEDAATAFQRCVMCDKTLKSGEGADFLVEAANAIRKVNTATCIEYMDQAIELYCSENRLDQASRLKKAIGEIYEGELEFTLAAKAYQEAADFFYAEGNRMSDYNQMRIKVAELGTLKAGGDLVEAIKIFEEVGDKYMENKLTAASAKEYYFKASLLYLCNDDIDSLPPFGIGAPTWNTITQKILSGHIAQPPTRQVRGRTRHRPTKHRTRSLVWNTRVLKKEPVPRILGKLTLKTNSMRSIKVKTNEIQLPPLPTPAFRRKSCGCSGCGAERKRDTREQYYEIAMHRKYRMTELIAQGLLKTNRSRDRKATRERRKTVIKQVVQQDVQKLQSFIAHQKQLYENRDELDSINNSLLFDEEEPQSAGLVRAKKSRFKTSATAFQHLLELEVAQIKAETITSPKLSIKPKPTPKVFMQVYDRRISTSATIKDFIIRSSIRTPNQAVKCQTESHIHFSNKALQRASIAPSFVRVYGSHRKVHSQTTV